MSDLICDCTVGTPLVMGNFPNNCGAEDYGYPYLLLFMKPEGVITGCTGGVVGVGMIQAAQAEADQDRIIVVGPITNGQRIESDRQTEEGADTIDGMTTVVSQTLNVTGKLKFLDEAIRDDLEGLNCYDRLKMWIITSTGWLFGGCEGYLVANFISGLIQEGYGTRSYIPLDYKFKVPGHDPAVQDDDYLTLTN